MQTPLATYRVQLRNDFPFSRARGIVTYLARLGISHLYASPIFKARAGSPHGYDVVDPAQINPELGGEEGLRELSADLRQAGLSLMLDIVPNHMAYGSGNSMLMDVLEKGPHSAWREFFDIDWDYPYENLRGRLLAPFLGTLYGEALDNGELRLVYDEAGLSLNYSLLKLPLRMESYIKVFGGHSTPLERALGPDNPDLANFIGTVSMLKTLVVAEGAEYPAEQFAHAKIMLWSLYAKSAEVRKFVDGELAGLNGKPGDPASFEALDELISTQLFRLSLCKVAAEELNYRRFFTCNELISLRAEKSYVFDHVHATALVLVNDGTVSALRVDHVDGLLDPRCYLERLRAAAGPEIYLAVEKILAFGEELAADWPIQGTTGYDFANQVNGVFCRGDSAKEFSKLYARFSGVDTPYDTLVCACKKAIISRQMAGNIANLARLLKNVSANDRYGRDITLVGLHRVLVEVMANFPVYRTYMTRDRGPSEAEKVHVRMAVARARGQLPGFEYELNFIEACLLLGAHKSLRDTNRDVVLAFVEHFQQYTAPIMAKGLEDTFLYIYNRLTSLNEVGGDPARFGITLEQFHEFNRHRGLSWPLTMNATATHDTKRGEDLRARINVLSEMPREWSVKLRSWAKLNESKKGRRATGAPMPDRNDEYLFYQTLLGVWPAGIDDPSDLVERLKDFAIKAAREAQVNTNWIQPDPEYENACADFIVRVLTESKGGSRFLEDFSIFQKEIAFFGGFNGLSQTLLKIVAPGVPDFYQGSELWDLNLVDPDNRRPVDFQLRERLLAAIESAYATDPVALLVELLDEMRMPIGGVPSGRIKLFLIWRALAVRRELHEVFEQGDYRPLAVEGIHAPCVIAFARSFGNRHVIAVAPRFVASFTPDDTVPLGELWGDTCLVLPDLLPHDWSETLSSRQVHACPNLPVAELFRHFPGALLTGQ